MRKKITGENSMEENNVFTAKTVDAALDLGLETLGLTLDEIDYEVIEEGKKKLFGSVKAVVKIIPKNAKKTTKTVQKTETADKKSNKNQEKFEKPARRTGETVDPVKFIDGLLERIGVDGKSKLISENEGILINIETENSARVIGKHGDMLDAVQCIAGAVANIGREEYTKVIVDCENYRAQREQTLKDLAAKLAAKAVETGRKIILEPMSPYERRVIHATLSDSTEVRTDSEGREPVRCVVVIPYNMRPGDKGIRYGERRHGDRGRRDDRRGRRDGDRRERRNGGDRPAKSARGGKKEIHFGTFLGNSNDTKHE